MDKEKLKDLESAKVIKNLLNNIPELKGNVQPVVVPGTGVVPYVMYQRTDTRFTIDKSCMTDEEECTFVIRAYAMTYTASAELYKAIMMAVRTHLSSDESWWDVVTITSNEGMESDLYYQEIMLNIKF